MTKRRLQVSLLTLLIFLVLRLVAQQPDVTADRDDHKHPVNFNAAALLRWYPANLTRNGGRLA